MATLVKQRSRKALANKSEMLLSGNFPVQAVAKPNIDIMVRDIDENEVYKATYCLKLTSEETVTLAVFAAKMASSPDAFKDGYYSVDRRTPWEILRDLANMLEAEDKAKKEAFT